MIDHLTNDIRRYEQVCLNVRDIHELRLIELPSTFHESKRKLRAIDPCLVDIRLSPSDENETRSSSSSNDHPRRTPISRQKRDESFGSDGHSALISSSSNESSVSFGFRSNEKYTAEESNDESMDEQMDNLRQLNINAAQTKPGTLLAKKILPRKNERSVAPAPNHSHQLRSAYSDQSESVYGPGSRIPHPATLKTTRLPQLDRHASPIRVTITSKLNPNAIPFFVQHRPNVPMAPPSFTFYERPRFRPRLPPVVSPDRSQSLPYGINNFPNHQPPPPPPPPMFQQRPHQRFVPPRQMILKKPFMQTPPPRTNQRQPQTPPAVARYRIQSLSTSEKGYYPEQQQQQVKSRPPSSRSNMGERSFGESSTSNSISALGYARQTSLPTPNELPFTFPIQKTLSVSRQHPTRRSTASIRSTTSLPYQPSNAIDVGRMHRQNSVTEPIGSHRAQRTYSGASSCSSLSLDIGPHSIVQFDLSTNPFMSSEGQYDFEKANEEFRRYLELEQLVTRRASSHCSTGSHPDDPSLAEPLSQSNSYKKEISFFDRISCTATTGTAVAYTEMDETEKNLETFGDDALLVASNATDEE